MTIQIKIQNQILDCQIDEQQVIRALAAISFPDLEVEDLEQHHLIFAEPLDKYVEDLIARNTNG